jgi:hypothetical protein
MNVPPRALAVSHALIAQAKPFGKRESKKMEASALAAQKYINQTFVFDVCMLRYLEFAF